MYGIDYAVLRRRLRLGPVLELVGFVPSSRCGPQVRGPCPIHGSSTPRSRSFAAHLERHCWHCFRCGAHGNVLDLWQAVTGQPLYAASLELCQRLHVDVPWLPARHAGARSPPPG
jgi:DNA primase